MINTGELGSFAIISNKSVGQTVRSIKAVTGRHVESISKTFAILNESLTDIDVEVEKIPQGNCQNADTDVDNALKMLKKLKQVANFSIFFQLF